MEEYETFLFKTETIIPTSMCWTSKIRLLLFHINLFTFDDYKRM